MCLKLWRTTQSAYGPREPKGCLLGRDDACSQSIGMAPSKQIRNGGPKGRCQLACVAHPMRDSNYYLWQTSLHFLSGKQLKHWHYMIGIQCGGSGSHSKWSPSHEMPKPSSTYPWNIYLSKLSSAFVQSIYLSPWTEKYHRNLKWSLSPIISLTHMWSKLSCSVWIL